MSDVLLSRGRRLGELPQQEQSEASEDDVHGGAAASVAGQLPAGLEPGRPGPRAYRTDHRAQQAGHPGLVPELQGASKETPKHWEDEIFSL